MSGLKTRMRETKLEVAMYFIKQSEKKTSLMSHVQVEQKLVIYKKHAYLLLPRHGGRGQVEISQQHLIAYFVRHNR